MFSTYITKSGITNVKLVYIDFYTALIWNKEVHKNNEFFIAPVS